MLKVLLVSTLYHPNIIGGAEIITKIIAEELVKKGHEAVVLTTQPRGGPKVRDVNGVRVYYLPVRNLYRLFGDSTPGTLRKALWHGLDSFNPFMASTVGSILDRESPDTVNTHNIVGFSPAIWRAVKKRKIPLVHTLHDQYLLCPRSTMFNKGQNCMPRCAVCRVYGWPRKRATGLVDVVTGVSRFILERHAEYGYFPNTRNAVIYNGYDLPGDEPSRAFEAGAHGGPLRFGFLGRLSPAKGLDRLLGAFMSLEPGAGELWLAGRGAPDYVRQLKALSRGRDDVRWMGFVKPEALLSEVDVLVVPSLWHDTAPLVILEGLSYGLPVIGALRGGIPELIGAGVGWIYEPDEPGALEALLRCCLEHRRELTEMGERAKERARDYSVEANINGYLAVYRSLVRKANE